MPMVPMTVDEFIAYEKWKGVSRHVHGEPLTERQMEILRYICDFAADEGVPPSIREIGMAFDIRSTNGVADHLIALERKGWILRSKMRSRGLKILKRLA